MTILDFLAFVLFALSLKLELMEQRRRRERKLRRERSGRERVNGDGSQRVAMVRHDNGEAAA